MEETKREIYERMTTLPASSAVGDTIESLPVDSLPPAHEEKDMIQWMFQRDPVTGKRLSEMTETTRREPLEVASMAPEFKLEIKSLLFLFVVCWIFCAPWMDAWMISAVPSFQSMPLVRISLKALLMSLCLLLVIHQRYLRQP